MGKKKFFIDKNKCVTFKLQPKTEQRPVITGDPELTNIVNVTDQELAEREKYGIFFNDNYNYMYHLKSRDEPTDVEVLEKTEILVPKSAVKVPTVIAERDGREVAISFNDAKLELGPSSSGVVADDLDIDPDLLAAMEAAENGDLMGEDGDFDLDDDFLQLAGGVDDPQKRVFEQFRKSNPIGSDSEEDDEDDTPQDDALFVAPKPILKKADNDSLDQRFSDFYERMDNEDEEFDEDDEDFGQPDDMLDDLADEFKDQKTRGLYEKPDEISKRLTLEAYEKQESAGEKTEKILVPVREKRAKWDCESIVSTYSNIYNHPTLIKEEPKRKETNLTKKVHRDVEMMDDTVSVRSATSTVTYRPKGETTDERRERKTAIKAERRLRRQEKKANKDVFKEEKKKIDAQRGAVNVQGKKM